MDRPLAGPYLRPGDGLILPPSSRTHRPRTSGFPADGARNGGPGRTSGCPAISRASFCPTRRLGPLEPDDILLRGLPFVSVMILCSTWTIVSTCASRPPRLDDLERPSFLLLLRRVGDSELVMLSCCTTSSPEPAATRAIAVSRDVPVEREKSSEVLVAGSDRDGVDVIEFLHYG